MLERNLPNLQFALQQQRLALEDIQTYIADRDKHMQEEIAMVLGHVRSSCELEMQGEPHHTKMCLRRFLTR